MELNTQRLILRPITLDDAPAFFAYSKNPNVGPNAGWKPHETLEETIEIIKTVFLSQKHVFGIVLNHAPTLIGSIGLIDDPKRQNKHAQMLGYAIGEPYWGQGYMTEAVEAVLDYGFKDLELDLISAYCYPHNTRSKRVLQKCGFAYEGKLRQCEILYDGKVYDNECYALLKEQHKKSIR